MELKVIFDNVQHPWLIKSKSRSFTVIINSVRLQDSGIYYCGIERWGKDPLTKVKVTVSKAHAPKTQNPSTPVTVTSQDTTEGPCSSSVCKSGHATTDHIMTTTIHSPISVQPNGTKGTADVPVLVGAALGVVMFLLLLSLAVFRKRSRSLLMALKPAGTTVPVDAGQEEEDPGHVYDVMVLYSVVSLPQEDPSAEYCMVQFSDPPQGVGEDSLYYRVAPH
ncbi:hypothetical protein MATL_G00106030 [Megalops atlanticus]|uniref:Uncharacterized protein n=1 Tax=Megalops atlanticus TaxID=7932 RepID=A0A9D3TDL1_MEGAT|nr:hypothetical protein MATL_G00106030 [Megalops atlanticus]